MKEVVVFGSGQEEIFRAAGLEKIGDFFEFCRDHKAKPGKSRTVIPFELGEGDEARRFFIKWFFRPTVKEIAFTWRNFGRLYSQAEVEWLNAQLLLSKGIDTYKPMCYGEQLYCGVAAIEKRSFIVTETLAEPCLTEFVKNQWETLGAEQKEKLICCMGRFIRKIHDEKISFPNLSAKHLFLKTKDEGYDFAIIDLHPMIRQTEKVQDRGGDLGNLDQSLVEKYFEKSQKELLIEAYAGDDYPDDFDELRDAAQKRSATLTARNKKHYY